jgi:hypothetical protein
MRLMEINMVCVVIRVDGILFRVICVVICNVSGLWLKLNTVVWGLLSGIFEKQMEDGANGQNTSG